MGVRPPSFIFTSPPRLAALCFSPRVLTPLPTPTAAQQPLLAKTSRALAQSSVCFAIGVCASAKRGPWNDQSQIFARHSRRREHQERTGGVNCGWHLASRRANMVSIHDRCRRALPMSCGRRRAPAAARLARGHVGMHASELFERKGNPNQMSFCLLLRVERERQRGNNPAHLRLRRSTFGLAFRGSTACLGPRYACRLLLDR